MGLVLTEGQGAKAQIFGKTRDGLTMFRRDPLADKTLFAHQVIDHSLLRRSFAQAQRVIPLICLYASQYGDA